MVLTVKWHGQYGPIICIRFGSLKIIALGSHKVTHELLEKRGSNYSSRPKFLADRVSNGLLPTFLPFREKWKSHHRLHTSLLTLQASQKYQVVQDVESKQIDLRARYASSQIFSLAYGKRMPHGDEPEVRELEEVMRRILESISLGEEVFPNVGALYEAGTDSTAIVLDVFVMACLDAVVGMRMPTFTDLPMLPYVRAIVSEVFRWRHPSPGGLHHAADEDDIYQGFLIPKGTAVVANHFSLDTDESIFDHPFDFEPDRWIRNPARCRSALLGLVVVLARDCIWVGTLFLWAYDIGYAYEKGRRLEVDPWDLTQGIGVRPTPFRASFCVRGEKRHQIISQAWKEAEKDVDVLLEQVGCRAPMGEA
ncbi:cytochrome P450 [Aspergillus bertholletiae]|uniref:Cytochrome P450 n=1 Tax=Aspergillus bertholletiae TaxID=1226010 RepID=A0A5N7AZ26_9EURO|nr:cytochrome P450 [Aspergillus bertholletiae]